MVKSSKPSVTKRPIAGVRRSSRATKVPQRFRPGGTADVPSALEELIHKATFEAAGKAELPLTLDAVTALEDALKPAVAGFLAAVVSHADKNGRHDVCDADFDSVLCASSGLSDCPVP
eukprot:m.385586 g.385586  ORF g.385586 m.385586 type:complete len:118 (+) comp21010_c0_seq1:355-708(+)